MNDEFNSLRELYANWPQLIDKAVADNALVEFHECVSCDSLRELPVQFVLVYIHESGHKILLNRNGFIKKNTNNNENSFDLRIGATPQCLQGLTIPEQLLISAEPTSLSTVLPLPVYQLCDHLKIVFVGEKQPSEKQLKKTTLESLLENEVPMALLATTIMVNIDPRKLEHYTGYMIDPIDEEVGNKYGIPKLHGSIDGSTELRNLDMTYTDNDPISEQERTLKLLEKMIQESTDNRQNYSRTILMPHSNVPKNEYVNLSLLLAAFSTLFPYGVSGHENNFCKYYISFKQYIKHRLRLRDPKFRHYRSFVFAAFDTLRRKEIASETYLIAKQSNFKRSAELISKLTPNDIKIAIKQKQDNQPITNGAVLELTKNINVVSRKIMGSHQLQNLLRNEIRAVIILDGSPSLFVTINPTDLHSSIVIMYAEKEIDINNLLPEDFPTVTERARLAHLDPTAIKNYYTVTEYQDRGTPHCHMLIWLQGASDPIELRNRLKLEDFRKRLILYINKIIKEDISYLFSNNDYLTDKMLDAEYKAPKTILEKKVHPSI
ncbi:8695_t:CDS:2 [Diversispora eburnea]|uniref:8695_t:CDS:1 n=1 Tax=Diversispora eburnea TaxID=1213867 RepID=A0A9N8VKW4_9GLOM|nr:8695_t:CDS:2 [Diversispora eburnea]